MENSDVVKEEVRVRLEKFEEVVGAIPKHQKTLSEIKAFLETLLPVVFDFPQQENKIEDLNSRFRRLTSIRKRIRTVGCSNDELEKVTKEENMGVDTLDDKNAIANASKTNLWKSFWCRNKNKSTTESPIWETDTFFDNLVLVRKKLELEIEVIEKTIFLNRALIEKSIVGKELVIFEMFLKKEHLRETLSSSEEFLLSLKKETSESFLISLETGRLELEERLESVSFGETALEEKKRNSFDKEKEIANSFSATEFKKLNEEKRS